MVKTKNERTKYLCIRKCFHASRLHQKGMIRDFSEEEVAGLPKIPDGSPRHFREMVVGKSIDSLLAEGAAEDLAKKKKDREERHKLGQRAYTMNTEVGLTEIEMRGSGYKKPEKKEK